MTKMRVHELAKELGMENKELMDVLTSKHIDVKSHMSSLSDEVVEQVRQSAGKSGAAKSAAKQEQGETADAPKKKNIVQVFRPQNSKNGSRPAGRNQGQSQGQGQGQRPRQAGGSSRSMNGQSRPRTNAPAGGYRSNSSDGVRSGVQAQSTASMVATDGQQPQRGYQNRRQGENGQNQGQRSYGYRENRENREHRDNREGRPSRYNQGGERNFDRGGERNYDRGGERNFDRGGERNFDRSGERGQSRDRGGYGQNQGQRQNGNSSRPGGFSGNGNRSGSGFQGGNQRNAGGARPGERRDRRDEKSSIAAPLVEQQKQQRNKAKDKEKDNKKKEYKENEFDSRARKGKKQKPVAEVQKPQQKQAVKKEEQIKQIVIPEVLTIKELADKMKIVPSVIVKKLFLQGKVVTVNQEIDYETAEEIAMEFEVLCEKEKVVDVIEELLREDEEDTEKMQKRPPVVCVMGHVDHGKTSLLDAIRHTNVIDREAGGITQHIGAYVVEINDEKITFLDTPGHEAFTAMRMRGANATDIAILVVAADDGVMPQTIEAINHAKAAGIEIIVAINKIDKPSANVERVKQELTEYELIPEDWGGSTIFVPVSARTRDGIQELLEMILLTAEVMELKANPDRTARGLVIEGELDKGKGSVATVLVQKGTLRVGDAIAAGSAHGKVRAMMDDKGRRVKEAGPSQPVEILGLNDVPNAGEVFVSCATEKEARNFAGTFISQNKVKLLDETKSRMSLDDLFTQIKEGNLKELNIIVKADVQGSVEALKQSLLKLSNDEVVVKIIHGGVGAINESDVILASASNAIIIGFNVRPDATAKEIADNEGVDLRLYRVIYNAIEDVEAAMKGMLDPIFEEKVLGHAEVRQTFKASGVGTIAGSYVLNGLFERNCKVRLTRDGIVIFDGPLASLKRFKDDVKEVKAGYECGFVFENFNDIKEGDQVEAYKMVEVERK
jgi:translation initiation factor IF-2